MPVTLSPPALRAHRESAGLSRPQVAAIIGKTTAAIEQFEHGTSRPNADTLGLLASAYGCEVGDFYDEGIGDSRDRYIAAVCRLLPPLTDDEIERFAGVIRARRSAPTALSKRELAAPA